MLASSIAQIALTVVRRSLAAPRRESPPEARRSWRVASRCCPDCEYSWVMSPTEPTCMFCGGPGVAGRLDEQDGIRLRP
ncbi:MAG TPA: hypothetical protein VFP54_11700 [Acidimicrobiales bacterium]|nr:hypothetical protein [Acidimicrobiales bacterium]